MNYHKQAASSGCSGHGVQDHPRLSWPSIFIKWLAKRGLLPCSLHTPLCSCGGVTGDMSDSGSALTLSEKFICPRELQKMHRLYPPLIKLSPAFGADLSWFWISLPPTSSSLEYLWSHAATFMRGESFLWQPQSSWILWVSWQEKTAFKITDPRRTWDSREAWGHWTTGGRIWSCQNQKGWDDWGPEKGLALLSITQS